MPHLTTPLRILVPGGAGFLGRSLARELATRGHQVRVLDLRPRPLAPGVEFERDDVLEGAALARSLREGVGWDVLVHLAARVGVRTVLADAPGCARENVRAVQRLVELLVDLPRARRPRVFLASSSEVYAEKAGRLAEHDALRTEHTGRWAYAASKIEGERLCERAAGLFSATRAPVALRFFNVVGPGQDSASGMVLPSFLEHARARLALPVHGDGSQLRTYAHVDEVARTLADLVEHPALPGGPLNVGGSAQASVRELAEQVLAASASPAGLRFLDARARLGAHFEEVHARAPDLTRLARLGVYLPARTLAEIVEDAWRRHPEAACASLAS